MTLPEGWTAETETVDRIRLEVPVADLEKAVRHLRAKGVEYGVGDADPAGRTSFYYDRPSRSVPLDELLAWLEAREEAWAAEANKVAGEDVAPLWRDRAALLYGLRRDAAKEWGGAENLLPYGPEKWGGGKAEEESGQIPLPVLAGLPSRPDGVSDEAWKNSRKLRAALLAPDPIHADLRWKEP